MWREILSIWKHLFVSFYPMILPTAYSLAYSNRFTRLGDQVIVLSGQEMGSRTGLVEGTCNAAQQFVLMLFSKGDQGHGIEQ